MIEGELKRIKSFVSSSRDVYRVFQNQIQIKKLGKNSAVTYKNKFDLTVYMVRTSAKARDTFYLEPNEAGTELALSKVEFKAKNAEERARWVLAIHKSMKENEMTHIFTDRQSMVPSMRQSTTG